MIDIVKFGPNDLGVADTDVPRAGNILSIQLSSLTYAPDLGIDLVYFLSEGVEFQNESFRSYLIERLANSGINVSSVIEQIETLFTKLTFNLGNQSTGSGLIAR